MKEHVMDDLSSWIFNAFEAYIDTNKIDKEQGQKLNDEIQNAIVFILGPHSDED